MTAAPPAGFVLDEFQRRAIEHLDAGRSVLVSAPTGSGKTVVADHAVDLALAANRRAFYTTPIKALSNQKYRDLRSRLGPQRVGLLTGDNVIAGEADVVVMTTEVLRWTSGSERSCSTRCTSWKTHTADRCGRR